MNEKSIPEKMKDFMITAGQEIPGDAPQVIVYQDLIVEESNEFIEAVFEGASREHKIKEAVDIIYVCMGYLHSLGVNVEDAFTLVHDNNMLKVKEVDKQIVNGKVQKSEASRRAKQALYEALKML